MSNYFEREVKRRNFVVDRWNFREQEKRELELEAKRKAGVSELLIQYIYPLSLFSNCCLH